MTNWAERKPAGCETCTLIDQPGPCYGAGDRANAKLIYIAQNPGAHEVAATPMTPLVGPSGNVFNRQLTEAGVRRDELYITNVVKCLTPDNRPPTGHEIKCCSRIIDAELKACKADTVLLAGDVAFKAFIGIYSTYSPHYHPPPSIMVRMGCVEQRNGRKWIGTIHPAFIMRMPDFKEEPIDHLKKAMSIAGVTIPLPKVISDPTDDDIQRHRSAAKANGVFADDVETGWQVGDDEDFIGGDFSIDMCGYSAVRYEAIILRTDQIEREWGEVYRDHNVVKMEHNGVFDNPRLERITQQANRKFDTLTAFHYLQSFRAAKKEDKKMGKKDRGGPGFALKPFCVSKFTNLPYYDREIEKWDRKFYCGLDNIATLLAGREQWRRIKELGLEEVFFKMGMPIPYILDKWRFKGVNVDLRRAILFRKFLEKRIAQAQLLMAKLLGPMFNPGSPQQVAALMYDKWGLPKQYNEKRIGREIKRSLTTDNEARKRLRKWIATQPEESQQGKYKVARIFLDLQDYLTGEETKLEFLDRIAQDGRVHPYFKGHGTSSFRLSSTPNLQNWPVYDLSQWGGARRDVVSEGVAVPTGETITKGMGSLRSIIIPDDPETDSILTIDFEQIELWAYAQQTGCKWLLDIYHKGEYIYGTVYEKFYKLPFFQTGRPRKKKFKLESVSEKFLRRAKAIPLGFLYGRSPGAVAEEHGWTLAEATTYRNQWFALCPELEVSYAKDRYTMEQKGCIRYPFGHVIHYPSCKPQDVYAMRGQNPAAGMLLSSIVLLDREFEQRRYENTRMMMSVHDSISFNIPDNRIVEVYEQSINPVLSRAVPELDGFVFRHSCEVGKRWDSDVLDYNDWKAEFGART